MLRIFPLDLSVAGISYARAFSASHRGTDIFAPRGTDVYAVDAGTVVQGDDPKGGTVAYLTSFDGSKYYYAHLDAFIGTTPRRVTAGEVIGAVGNSGNAQGKATHLHFQIAELGQGTIDPYPLLLDVDPKHRGHDEPGPLVLPVDELWDSEPPTQS